MNNNISLAWFQNFSEQFTRIKYSVHEMQQNNFIRVLLSILIIIFPLYIIVYRKNRKREKNLPTFPIVSHFHKATVKSYTFLFILIFWLALATFSDSVNFGIVTIIILTVVVIIIAITNEVNELLIGIFSIYTFIVVFYPHAEKYLKSKKDLKWKIRFIYFFVVCKNVVTNIHTKMNPGNRGALLDSFAVSYCKFTFFY